MIKKMKLLAIENIYGYKLINNLTFRIARCLLLNDSAYTCTRCTHIKNKIYLIYLKTIDLSVPPF